MIKAATSLEITGGILVGHDGSPAAAESVRWAARLAGKLGTPLHVVRCWSISTAPRPATATDGYVPPLTDFETAVHDRLKADIAELGLEPAPTCHVLHGPAGRRLLEASERVDMLVMGTRGAGGFLGLHLGSTADQVVRHARCPVVVVPTEGIDDPPDLDTQLAD